MKYRVLTKSISLAFVALLLVATFTSQAQSEESVSVKDNGFNLDSQVVPSNLKWSKDAISMATKAQRYLYRQVMSEINLHKKAGAVRLKRISHPTESGVRNWRKLGLSENLYSIDGYDSAGELVYSGETLFADYQAIQSRTVYLGQETCLLRPFNLFDYATWFTTQCSITVEPKEKFLQASMQTWVSLAGGFTPDGRAIASELQTVIAEKLKYEVDDKTFNCLGCSNYINTPYKSFPLEYSAGFWPYKIKYQKDLGKLNVSILKPNYVDLMRKAKLKFNYLIAFDDQTPTLNPLFPLVG